jgi:high-affinity iron transporter
MGGTFIVTLREAFEAALLLGIVYTYLDKIGRRHESRYVTGGAVLGLVASLALGVAVSVFSGPLVELGPDVVAAGVIFLAVGLLSWHTWWMQRHARSLRGELLARIDAAHVGRRLWMVGLIAFTGVFREGSETVLFLWGLVSQATAGLGWASVGGGLLGVATAAALGWAIFRGGRRVSLAGFFAVTTIVLLFLAAGLASAGVGRLQSLGLLPWGSPVWDTSGLLDDQGGAGSFFSGLVGYRARPTAYEVAAYVMYLAIMAVVLFGPARSVSSGAARADTTERPVPSRSSLGG